MSLVEVLQSWARDSQLHAALVLIAADVIFGILAALKSETFRLVRIADTLRDDVGFKLAPWLALFVLGKVSNADVFGVVDVGAAADVAWGGLTLALVASILGSLRDLGISLPAPLAGKPVEQPPHS